MSVADVAVVLLINVLERLEGLLFMEEAGETGMVPKQLESANAELLPPRPEGVGPKIPGTGDLVIVWQFESSAEGDGDGGEFGLNKVEFEGRNGEKVITGIGEDIIIGNNKEAWMGLSKGSDGSVSGRVTCHLRSLSSQALVSLALSAETKELSIVVGGHTEAVCGEGGVSGRAVIDNMVFCVALLPCQEGVSNMLEARVLLLGRLPVILGFTGAPDATVSLRYGRQPDPIALRVVVGDREVSLADEGISCRVMPRLPEGMHLEADGSLAGAPRISGRSEHCLVVANTMGESTPYHFVIDVTIAEEDMCRIRKVAAEGGLGVTAITDRVALGSEKRAAEVYRHFAYTLPEHQKQQRDFWAREKQDVIVLHPGMTDKWQAMIDDSRHSDGDTTTRVFQLKPGAYALPGGILRLRNRRVVVQGVGKGDVTIIGQIRVEHPGCVIQNVIHTNCDTIDAVAEGLNNNDGLSPPCAILVKGQSNGTPPVCTIQDCDIRCLRNSCVKFVSPSAIPGFEAPGGLLLQRNRFAVIRDSTVPAVDLRGASGRATENSFIIDNIFSPLCYGVECQEGYHPTTRGSATSAIDTFEAQTTLSSSLHLPTRDFNIALRKRQPLIPAVGAEEKCVRKQLPPRGQPNHRKSELECCGILGQQDQPTCFHLESSNEKKKELRWEKLGFRNTKLNFYTFCGKSDAWRKREALNMSPDASSNLTRIRSSVRGSEASLVWKFPDNGRIRTE
ncbi:hypothetical protein FOL47_009948 [Perkinsus chesapeaki]|uniref:Uncharacterized protein n=1 Tax=Perkinsus chesapeaki TaxID=330153 RepID=A0A7J6MRE8_PERCH|nr:hypothetical protein FOL47_009948 [Perkinsus chesapeaki]